MTQKSAYYASHKEERKVKAAAHYAAHKEEINTRISSYRSAHKEEIKARDAAYRAAHKEERKAYRVAHKERQNAYRVAHKKVERARAYKRQYGISIEERNKIFELQKGKCPICKHAFTKTGKRRVATDHCHKAKYVRGLICNACNTAEGAVETPKVALALYNYMMQNELLSYQSNGNH